MGTLTKRERDGLEDVFSSIHAHDDKYEKLKRLSALLMRKSVDFSAYELVKRAKFGLKVSKLSHLLINLTKKKRNLSK